MSVFAQFAPRLQEAIVARLGWTSLRPVQEMAGESILAGKNAVVLAPTAGGKTEASIFPTLSLLIDKPVEGVGAIYIAPIKALLNNQSDRLGQYTEMVGLRSFVWHGDTPARKKTEFKSEPSELLMTTPESLEVMLVSPRVPASKLFSDLRMVVIDEVHALAGTDRGAHLMSVLERLLRFTDNDVQRVGLSATVGNPDAILGWLKGSSRRQGVVVDPPKNPARRSLSVQIWPARVDLAKQAARQGRGAKSLFFCQSRALTESVAERMSREKIDVYVHHSSVSLEERQRAEETFHHGGAACIACTSTLELGIDVGDLDLVFQANAPSTVSSFMQRMGRTGRREGQVANTTFFCEDAESVLQAVALIELAKDGWVEPVPPQTRCWPVLVHQLLALTLQFGGVTREQCWDQLSRVPDFSGITRTEFDKLLDHMTKQDYLFQASGQLSMGERAERVYGRKNFLEMYAVFSTPVLYTVKTAAGKEIGSLEQDFVDSLVEEISCFLLGGRAWVVEHISHKEKTLRVHQAPRGKEPSWNSFIPQMLGYHICQRIKKIIASDKTYPHVHEPAAEALQTFRHDLGPLLRKEASSIQLDETAARWWTFAGGRINFTLKYALAYTTGWKVVADNFQLRVEDKSLTHEKLTKAIASISNREFWQDTKIWQAIIASLPEYRLSKFQQALPAKFSQEMVGRYLLDSEGARTFLGSASPSEQKTRHLRDKA